jgi:hypothetical protein
MKLTNTIVITLLVTAHVTSVGQEIESYIQSNKSIQQRYAMEQRWRQRESSRNILTLPFFDDFSRFSLPTNDPLIPADWQMWEDRSAYINNTFAESPLTIGVATLDGIAEDGTAYADTLYFPTIQESFLEWGSADTLTSLPINLEGYVPEDNVYLVFHYQGGGFGNAPDEDGILGAEGDTLAVEFFTPLQQGSWQRVWSKEGNGVSSPFDTVFIHINDFIHLQNGFKFRFRNYGTLHGALDHWNIDYVIINNNIDSTQFFYDEVAFQYQSNSLLNDNKTAMPWTHYLSNPSFHTSANFTYQQRNLGETSNIATTWKIEYQDNILQSGSIDANTQGNGYSEFSRTVPLEGFTFTAPTDDKADFLITTSFNPTDIHTQNDTMRFKQRFENYYAYDDGSAERAWGLTGTGNSMALRFYNALPDTLIGVMIHFTEVQYLASAQTFAIQAWTDASGVPGNLITTDIDNYTQHFPRYNSHPDSMFVFYPLQDSLFIPEGNFHVGFIQQNSVSLNMGLDKNTNINTTRLLYKLQGNDTWINSTIQGSVMFRPVFKSGMPYFADIQNSESPEKARVFPNPASNSLQIVLSNCGSSHDVMLYNFNGQQIHKEYIPSGTCNHAIDVSKLSKGAYLLRIHDENGSVENLRIVIE